MTQDPQNLLVRANTLKDKGYNEAFIAQELGLTTSQLRALRTEGQTQKQEELATRAGEMKAANYSNADIADALGLAESDVRIILAD